LTILEIIQRGSEFLERKGVDSPRLQVELFLAHVLKMPRMQLYLNFEKAMADADIATVRSMVQRRATREPSQYIIGNACFCGLDMRVSRNVLIPRPETELLAERAWTWLAAKAGTSPQKPLKALDFGTGSGCLAIALARHTPGVQVHALDYSNNALDVARENASSHQAAIEFHLGDGFAALPPGLTFDLIVSNPPYIPTAEIATLDPEVRDYEPVMALDGGVDGLDFYRRLASEAAQFLEPEGRIMLEFGDGQGEALRVLFEAREWVVDSIESDYTRRPRNLTARRNAESSAPGSRNTN
jgi:release factor glutamine methyltransferase